MGKLRNTYAHLKESSPEDYLRVFQKECKYIYTKFPDVFDRVVKNDMNLDVFEKIVMILKMIEDGKVNQSEASALVGKLSQRLFFQTSATQSATTQPVATVQEEVNTGMSWKEFKQARTKL
jgi:hypothetical protein